MAKTARRVRRPWLLCLAVFTSIYFVRHWNTLTIHIDTTNINNLKPGGFIPWGMMPAFEDITKIWTQAREKLIAQNTTTKVLLFTYMRGGSSIAGEMFNSDPRATLWYEPLDPFYGAYYGFGKEMLPQNLGFHKNGSRRSLGDEEKRQLTDFLEIIFGCNYEMLPAEALSHYFLYESAAMESYWDCYRPYSKDLRDKDRYDNCKTELRAICGGHVQWAIFNRCHHYIKIANTLLREEHNGTWGEKSLVFEMRKYANEAPEREINNIPNFARHALCMADIKNGLVRRCIGRATYACRHSSIQAIETTRMNMENLERLVMEVPDLHVFMFTRDPRGIVNSRLRTKKLVWDKNNMRHSREAQLFCPAALEDLNHFRRLQRDFPEAFHIEHYEDLAVNTTEVSKRIFTQFGLSPSREWGRFARSSMHTRKATSKSGGFGINVKNVTEVAYKWKREIPPTELEKVNDICSEVIQEMGYIL